MLWRCCTSVVPKWISSQASSPKMCTPTTACGGVRSTTSLSDGPVSGRVLSESPSLRRHGSRYSPSHGVPTVCTWPRIDSEYRPMPSTTSRLCGAAAAAAAVSPTNASSGSVQMPMG
jgi:hypothetical protein